MRVLGISGPAERDLEEVSDYTQSMWGERQGLRYMAMMQERLELLAPIPHMGRPCDSVAPGLGLRRSEVEKHVVFYVEQPQGIGCCMDQCCRCRSTSATTQRRLESATLCCQRRLTW